MELKLHLRKEDFNNGSLTKLNKSVEWLNILKLKVEATLFTLWLEMLDTKFPNTSLKLLIKCLLTLLTEDKFEKN